MTDEFSLHPRLAADCFQIGRFALCRVLMMNDAQYPWFILVPERPDIREIYELDDNDQARLLAESSALSRIVMKAYQGDKLNVAALGNLVPQLHVHHIVRYVNDSAWPKPVWGLHPPMPMDNAAIDERLRTLAPHQSDGLLLNGVEHTAQ